MAIVNRSLSWLAATVLAATPAAAQGGGRPTRTPARPPTVQRDTGKHVTQAPAVSLDFQDQDLKVVLDALVAAGDLNASMTNIPSQRVTLHLGHPVSRDSMMTLIKSLAESNGLKVTASPTLIQIAGPAPEPVTRPLTPQQMIMQELAQSQQQQQMRLYTYRLKHASAVQLAPVLTSLFSGFVGNQSGGRTTVIPNPNGGFTTIQTPAVAFPPGNITTIPTPFGGNGRGAGRGAGNAAVAVQLSGALSSQAGDIRIVADEGSNSLLIRATDADWALVQQIIQGVDLRPLQVLIEVTIAEVQRTRDLDVGVSGSVKRVTGSGKDDVSVNAPSQASARDFVLALTGGHGTVNYNVALAALQERGDVRVLSLPVIIAQNNRQATLNVGSSRPFVQVSQTVPNDPTGRVQTVQYIDVGTVLTITPTINPDGYVNLQVTQTDNSATNEVQFDAPVINKREATTQIFIRDGQTTVIGGLADNTHSSDVSGIPILSRIPLIGPLLFGSVTRNEDANELFLFLTPHIISSDDDIDKLREGVRNGSEMLKQVNIGPRIVPPADTLPVPTRPDTTRPPAVKKPDKPDSLTLLRRRPPADSIAPFSRR
ncbi:MAG TPA: secretin N-terminal domain-containing protein [Gemmatimonadaceae bacterium]|nr:secretin N-terminal domain-containing protein [Gemmatimonadaceae bacterium]